VVPLLVFLRASGFVASEYDGNTVGLLGISLLHPRQVMWGKLASVIVSVGGACAVVYLSLILVFCAAFPGGAFHALAFAPLILATMISTSALYGAIATLISAHAKTVQSATRRAGLTVFLMFWVLGPLVGGFVGVLLEVNIPGLFHIGGVLLSLLCPAAVVAAPVREALADAGTLNFLHLLIGVAGQLALARYMLRGAGRVFAYRVARDREIGVAA
jgi:hypothetical protein